MPSDVYAATQIIDEALVHLSTARALIALAVEQMPPEIDSPQFSALGDSIISMSRRKWAEVQRHTAQLEYWLAIVYRPKPRQG